MSRPGCGRCVDLAVLFSDLFGHVADLVMLEIHVPRLKMQASVLRAVRQLPRCCVTQDLLDMCFILPTREDAGHMYIPCGAYLTDAFFEEVHKSLDEVSSWHPACIIV